MSPIYIPTPAVPDPCHYEQTRELRKLMCHATLAKNYLTSSFLEKRIGITFKCPMKPHKHAKDDDMLARYNPGEPGRASCFKCGKHDIVDVCCALSGYSPADIYNNMCLSVLGKPLYFDKKYLLFLPRFVADYKAGVLS